MCSGSAFLPPWLGMHVVCYHQAPVRCHRFQTRSPLRPPRSQLFMLALLLLGLVQANAQLSLRTRIAQAQIRKREVWHELLV